MKAIVTAIDTAASLANDRFEIGKEAYLLEEYKTALTEFRPLAEQGHAGAQYYLARMYDHGQGVPEDNTEAAIWYLVSAEHDHASAQSKLGLMFAEGRGVPQDYKEALKWQHKAAEQGNAYAQFWLGLIYEQGQGVPQDYIEAYAWFSVSAANDVEFVTSSKARDITAMQLTPEQLAQGQALAKEYLKKYQPEP